MKLHYYPETDSLYIELKAEPGTETREVAKALPSTSMPRARSEASKRVLVRITTSTAVIKTDLQPHRRRRTPRGGRAWPSLPTTLKPE